MRIEIDDDVAKQVQSLTTLKLVDRDYYFFADWLLRVGVTTIRAALKENPDLTLGDLVMLQFRKDNYH